MVSGFYQRHSRTILLTCLAILPFAAICGELIPSNNDVEAWLPRDSRIRVEYNSFCDTFGADETVLIAFEKPFPENRRLTAAARRISGLEQVDSCRTRADLIQAMQSNNVSTDVASRRMVNLLATPDGSLETLLVTLNRDGTADRRKTIEAIHGQLDYCGLENAILAGGPVVGTQLDRLGNRRNAAALFGLTILICWALLYVNIRCWKTSTALMLSNLFCIQLTQCSIWVLGYEMNFVLSALPVMVMVFTTASAIHFIGHFQRHYPHPQSIGRALKDVIKPAVFATLTTIIGLVSLAVSDVGPIPAFGAVAAVGTAFSFVIGILLTPAILQALNYRPNTKEKGTIARLERIAMLVVNRPWHVLVPGIMATLLCTVGVFDLRALISPLDFLPESDPVRQDTELVQRELTSPTSIEAVIDFQGSNTSFVERLRTVRSIEAHMQFTDNVCHVLSLADFFPEELSENTLSLSRLATASSSDGVSGLMADGSRLWRVSLRLKDDSPAAVAATMQQLQMRCRQFPVTFTGLAPLLEAAQTQIFDGFWKSFASAFVLITIVMIFALRSVSAGLIAMIPNLTPILLVFGTLGWFDFPIDIGIMMTASIALGLAVDGTFHFLFSYRCCHRRHGCRYRAVRTALLHTGLPIISSALISGIGLLALGLSPFRPTMRFGVLMFFLLTAALVGDLLLLPAFLAAGSKRRRSKPASESTASQELAAA